MHVDIDATWISRSPKTKIAKICSKLKCGRDFVYGRDKIKWYCCVCRFLLLPHGVYIRINTNAM